MVKTSESSNSSISKYAANAVATVSSSCNAIIVTLIAFDWTRLIVSNFAGFNSRMRVHVRLQPRMVVGATCGRLNNIASVANT
jgi:hypothetical protein